MATSDNIKANPDSMLRAMRDHLAHQLEKAAEPLVKESLAKIEIELRGALAKCIIEQLDLNYRVERYGTDLTITVRQPPKV